MRFLLEISPIMNNINQLKGQIKDPQSCVLYLKYTKLIGLFDKSTDECEKAFKYNLDGNNINENIFKNTQENFINLLKQMNNLYIAAIKQTQIYLLWIDENQQNKNEFYQLQQKHQGRVIVKQYVNNEEFRVDLMKYKEHPTVVIMSAVAAGSNLNNGDRDNFNYLKQNIEQLRIMGVFIYCGQNGINNCQHLMNDDSKLLKCITKYNVELQQQIDKLLVPSEYKRFILLKHIDYFIPNFKQEFLNICLNNLSSYSLLRLNPEKKNMKENFQKAKQYIISKKIGLQQDFIDNIQNIPDALQKCFQDQTTEEDISKQVIRLYTSNSTTVPVHQFLNSTMNILNEELMMYLKEYYFIFAIALYKYNDQNVSLIRSYGNSTTLFKGSSIPKEQFKDLKKACIIVLPGFSSFSTQKQCSFEFIQNQYAETVPVIFTYTYKCGTEQYPNRPKCIKEVSHYTNENEYIAYPYTCFIVLNIVIEKLDNGFEYYLINLSL